MNNGWAGSKVVEAFGYRVRFLWNVEEFEQFVDQVILPGWPEGGEEFDTEFRLVQEEDTIVIEHDDERPRPWNTHDSTADSLRQLVHIDIASYAPDLVFVHAGVVLGPTGVIILPGRSFAGKSTLTRKLVERGCAYYSDEYAVIDSQGLVTPFPRPLSERDPGQPNRLTPPTELGWHSGLGPARVAAVVSTEYKAQARWDPEEISAGQATLEMFSNTVSAQLEPLRAMRFLPMVAQAARCWKGPRGEAEETAELLLERLHGF